MKLNWYQDSILVILKRILENQLHIKKEIYRLSYACGSCPNESVCRDSCERDMGIIEDINEQLGIEN